MTSTNSNVRLLNFQELQLGEALKHMGEELARVLTLSDSKDGLKMESLDLTSSRGQKLQELSRGLRRQRKLPNFDHVDFVALLGSNLEGSLVIY